MVGGASGDFDWRCDKLRPAEVTPMEHWMIGGDGGNRVIISLCQGSVFH
jgi:hypothetical protein